MGSLSHRLAGAVAALTVLVGVVWPAQPAQANNEVVVDIAFVHYHSSTNISAAMRADLPSPLRPLGTCKWQLVRVTANGATYTLVASHTGSCERSPNPQWGDQRSAWHLDYEYGSHDYVLKAEFIYGDLYGYQYLEFSTI